MGMKPCDGIGGISDIDFTESSRVKWISPKSWGISTFSFIIQGFAFYISTIASCENSLEAFVSEYFVSMN